MASLDTLNVTNLGLLNINKKIINSRIFSGNLITSVGAPVISDGVASGFSQENYFTYSPITFATPEKISISFKGTFVPGGHPQCAFKLINSLNAHITLVFKDNSVKLLFNTQKLFSFNFSVENEADVSISLTLESNSYEFIMYSENKVIQKVESIPFTLPIDTFSILNLGNDTTDTENFWMGSIDVKEFFIYEDNEVIYTPSIGEEWTFSNILASDGSFPLTNSTSEAAGHVYSFDVKEISRSGSTVLLTCQIDDDAYLIIKEIGLYLKTKQGKVLFGSISGLNIDKTKGVPYDLILTVNTSISVVNAVGFPAENEIIVEDPDFIEFKDFDTVQQVNTYVLTNLERIIRMNAGAKGSYENSSIINNQAGIGHNRPQIIYRLQQKIEEGEDCYNSIDTFVQLVEALEYLEEEQIDFETVTVEGNATLLPNGEASGFSQGSYIEKQLYFTDTSEWTLSASVPAKNTIPHGTLLSLGNEESLDVIKTDSYTIIGNPTITADSMASGFSSSNYINTNYNWAPGTSTWEIRLKVRTPSERPSSGFKVILGSSSDYQCPRIALLYTGKWIFSIPNNAGNRWQREYWGTLDTALLNTDYYFKMYFTGTEYKLDYSFDNINWSNMAAYPSTTPVYNLNNPIRLGHCITNNDGWTGSIDLKQFSITVDGKEVFNGNRGGCPLRIGFENNGECYLQIKQEESINPAQLNSYYIKSPSNNMDAEMLYAWARVSSVPCYNFHCTNLPISNSPLVTFPQSQIIETKQTENLDPTDFTLSLRVKFNSIETQCIIGKQSDLSKASIELLLIDGFLKAIPYDSTDQSVITNNLVSRYKLKANTYYNIRFSYNGEKYSLHYESEPSGNEYIDTETINIYSSRTISLDSTNDLIVGDTLLPPQGIPENESYSLNGTIDFSKFNISSNPSWNSLSDLSLIYTNDRYPFTGDSIYDNNFYVVENSYVEDYTNGNIIDEHNVFQLLPNNNYLINISYSEDDASQSGTYVMDVTTNGTTERVLSRSIPIAENYSNRMLTPSVEIVGIDFLHGVQYNPYSSSLNLLNWNATQGDREFPFSHEVVLNSTNLIQYYNLPDSRNLQYAVHDLCNLDNKIRFLSNKFEGNKDIIDFSYPEGLTLCMKVDLKDSTPKVALYKSDLYNDIYFSLTLLNQTLTFSVLTSEGIVELSKPLDITEYSAYVDYPILVTVIAVRDETSLSLKMYRNNTLINSTEGIIDSAVVDPSMFILSNYIENMPTYEVEEDGEKVIKTVEPAKYVEDIIVIKGAISEEELFYINNLMNTNF